MSTSLSLAIPPPATRQVGLSSLGSPLELTRSISNRSDVQTPEENIKQRLQVYKTYLEHEVDFIDSEIRALVGEIDPAFMDLRNGLKIRFNTLQTKLARVNALLEVL